MIHLWVCFGIYTYFVCAQTRNRNFNADDEAIRFPILRFILWVRWEKVEEWIKLLCLFTKYQLQLRADNQISINRQPNVCKCEEKFHFHSISIRNDTKTDTYTVLIYAVSQFAFLLFAVLLIMPIFHDQIGDRCSQHFSEFAAFYWLKNADFSWGIAQGHHKMDTRSFWYNVKLFPKKNHRWPFGWDGWVPSTWCHQASISLCHTPISQEFTAQVTQVHQVATFQ